MEATTRKYTKLEERATELFTDTVEQPFGDWFMFSNIERADVSGDGYMMVVGADVVAYSGEGDEESRVAKHVSLRDIVRAIHTIAKSDPQSVKLHPSFRKRFAAAVADPDDTDFDAIDADSVLQVAVYGEVLFG